MEWFWENCCCCYSYYGYQLKKREKIFLTDEQIKFKALQMLYDWKIETYANNRFLYKIPIEKEREQLDLFIKKLKIDNIYL